MSVCKLPSGFCILLNLFYFIYIFSISAVDLDVWLMDDIINLGINTEELCKNRTEYNLVAIFVKR